jgi:hypothetical protein
MAHPSAAFPKSFTVVNTGTVTPQVGGYFTSILCVEAGTIATLIGSGMYVNGATTESNVANLALTAGMIIYGRFTSIQVEDGKYIAYYP